MRSTLRRWRHRPADGLIDFGAATAAGARPDNQDRHAVSASWAAVSDGVGGHAGGAVAAQLTIDTVVAALETTRRPNERCLVDAFRQANRVVRAAQDTNQALAEMSATLTGVVVVSMHRQRSRWLLAHLGDSPAWVISDGQVTRVTDAHTVAGELVRSGAIASEIARLHPGRNVVTRAIGLDAGAVPDTTIISLNPSDALVIASDGLEVVSLQEIGQIAKMSTATEAARRLVDTALARGARDNVTAVSLRHRLDTPTG